MRRRHADNEFLLYKLPSVTLGNIFTWLKIEEVAKFDTAICCRGVNRTHFLTTLTTVPFQTIVDGNFLLNDTPSCLDWLNLRGISGLLNLSLCSINISCDALIAITRLSRALKSLDTGRSCNDSVLINISRFCRDLIKLKVDQTHIISSEKSKWRITVTGVVSLLYNCNALEKLYFDGTELITSSDLNQIAEATSNCSSLTEIAFVHCNPFPYEGLMDMIWHCQHLTSLAFVFGEDVDIVEICETLSTTHSHSLGSLKFAARRCSESGYQANPALKSVRFNASGMDICTFPFVKHYDSSEMIEVISQSVSTVAELSRFRVAARRSLTHTQRNAFAPLQLAKEPTRKNKLRVTSRSDNTNYLEVCFRGIQIKPFSGQVGLFQVKIERVGCQAIGLAISLDAPVKECYATWAGNGVFQSSIPGLESFESRAIRYNDDVIHSSIGLMVDCISYPCVRFYIGGLRVHDQTIKVHDQFFFPLACPLNCAIDIIENPDIPALDCGAKSYESCSVLSRTSSPRPFPLWPLIAKGVGGGGAKGPPRQILKLFDGGMRDGWRHDAWRHVCEKLDVDLQLFELYRCCLPVVDVSGEERGRMFIGLNDTVLEGQLQFEEQTGVPLSAQRMALGGMKLEGSMHWGNVENLEKSTPVFITVELPEVLFDLLA